MSYFRNVQNNGAWQAGETYTFEHLMATDGGDIFELLLGWRTDIGQSDNARYALWNMADVLTGTTHPSISYIGAVPSTDGENEVFFPDSVITESVGILWSSPAYYDNEWIEYTLAISADAPVGTYYLLSVTANYGTLDIDAYEVYEITISADVSLSWPSTRPNTYDSEAVWGYNPVTLQYEWMTTSEDVEAPHILAMGGGRYKKTLVVVGHETIYFRET